MLPPAVEMLKTLIGEPSVSCVDALRDQTNLRVIEHLATWLEDLGFAVEVLPLPDKPGKGNLIARRGGRKPDDGSGLVLAGHTDTVPCDEALWQHDPFRLTERDAKFYGLGACDMKGFFPFALLAAARHAESRLERPLTIVATADEESSMDGARHLARLGVPKAAAAVIGEPTDMQPVYAHKGFAALSIAVAGASGHSSNPALGDNALEAMYRVMGALLAFRSELAERYSDNGFAVVHPTLNLGCLHAGDNPNRICGHAELKIDLRLLPSMDTTAIIDELRTRVASASGATPVVADPLVAPVPPYSTSTDGRLVKTLTALADAPARTVAFSTEAPFFQSLGIETVVFGPGSIDQAHQPNEYLDGRQFQPMEDVLTKLIATYCL